MRKPTWKQDTPRMQPATFMQSIEGWLMNLENTQLRSENADLRTPGAPKPAD